MLMIRSPRHEALFRVTFRLSLLLLLALGFIEGIRAEHITVRILHRRGVEVRTDHDSLAAAMANVSLKDVLALEIVEGHFTAQDWRWLRANREALSALRLFSITEGETSVADIPDTPWGKPYFGDALFEARIAGVKRVGNYAFLGCRGLVSVSLPAAVQLGKRAFRDCAHLSNVMLGTEPPKAIGEGLFEGCPDNRYLVPVDARGEDLSGAALDGALTAYDAVEDGGAPRDGLWYGFQLIIKTLYRITISTPEPGLMLSQRYADGGDPVEVCALYPLSHRLESVDYSVGGAAPIPLPIPSDAVSFTMPNADVEVHAELAFDLLRMMVNGTTLFAGGSLQEALSQVDLSSVQTLSLLSGKLFEADWLWLKQARDRLCNLSHFTVADPVRYVEAMPSTEPGDPYFSQSLQYVSISHLELIGRNAFSGLGGLKTALFPHLSYLLDYAFWDCAALGTVRLPEVKIIWYGAFGKCAALTAVEFPMAVNIGRNAFEGCSALERALLPNAEFLDGEAFLRCASLRTVSLPRVSGVGESCFVGCGALTSVRLPQALTIDQRAFSGCSALIEVQAPQLSQIAYLAFADCGSLRAVCFPILRSIGSQAFLNCAALPSLRLGAEPPRVGVEGFKGCRTGMWLIPVDGVGNPLVGVKRSEAIETYRREDDGEPGDDSWYGLALGQELYPVVVAPSLLGGTVISAGSAAYGESVRLVPLPDEGYEYRDGSLRAYCSGDPSASIPISADGTFQMPNQGVTVEALFDPMVYSLTYAAGAHGAILGVPSQRVAYGASGSAVQAHPDPGYRFRQWSDGGAESIRAEIGVTQAVNVVAEFEPEPAPSHRISYQAKGPGRLFSNPMDRVPQGQRVQILSLSERGFHLQVEALRVERSDGSAQVVPVVDGAFIMPDCDVAVEGSFLQNRYWLRYGAGVGGAVEGLTEQSVRHGEAGVAVRAVANAGFRFMRWSDGRMVNPRQDRFVDRNLNVVAEFEAIGIEENTTPVESFMTQTSFFHPNPASLTLWVDAAATDAVPTDAESNTLRVYSLSGALLMEQRVWESVWVDVSRLPKGVYLMRLGGRMGRMVKR